MRSRTKNTSTGGATGVAGLFGARGDSATMTRALDMLGGGGNAFATAFALMGIAEDEIRARWPGGRKGGEPREVFLLCRPTEPLRGLSPELYRAHVREIIDRVAKARRSEYALLTDAEVIGLLHFASLRHPLKHDTVLLFEHLFEKHLPTTAEERAGQRYQRQMTQRMLLPEQHAEMLRDLAEWKARTSPERSAAWQEMRREEAEINGI